MVDRIKNLRDIESIPPTTHFKFLPEDIEQVRDQSITGDIALIKFNQLFEGELKIFHGVVGKNSFGPMLEDNNLVAKPCPPFCSPKLESLAVEYPGS